MIFPVLQTEATVQVSDKIRLDATKTYATPDEAAISLVEIEPHTGDGFFDVTTNLYLDWQYPTDGAKTVTLRVTTDGSPELITKTITVLDADDDKLFSGDQDLIPCEPELLNWVRAGRNSFLDVHRAAQDRIMTYLDEQRIWDTNGDRLTLDAITDIQEVKDWSKFMTLRLIFEGISNAIDDVFQQKSARYKEMEVVARNRAALRLDRNGDGTTDVAKTEMRSVGLFRR